MIKINLLPQEIKGRQPRKQPGFAGAPSQVSTPSAIVPLVLIPVYIVIAIVGYLVYSKVHYYQVQQNTAAKTLLKLQGELKKKEAQFKGLETAEKMYKVQSEVISSLLPKEPLLWSEKLNQIALLIPHKVYITEMAMTEKVAEAETKESKDKRAQWEKGGRVGTAPSTIKKPIISQKLEISGISVEKDSEKRLKLMLDFIEALKTFKDPTYNRIFIEHFDPNIKILSTKTVKYLGVVVNKFKIEINSLSQN